MLYPAFYYGVDEIRGEIDQLNFRNSVSENLKKDVL